MQRYDRLALGGDEPGLYDAPTMSPQERERWEQAFEHESKKYNTSLYLPVELLVKKDPKTGKLKRTRKGNLKLERLRDKEQK